MKDFINIELNFKTLDRYYIRHTIFKVLKDSLPKLSGKILDIGCGKMPYRNYILENSQVDNYIGLDIETALEYDSSVKPDFTWMALPCHLWTQVLIVLLVLKF